MLSPHVQISNSLEWSIWVTVIAVILGIIGQAYLRQDAENSPNTMRVPANILVIGIISSASIMALAVFLQLFSWIDVKGESHSIDPFIALWFIGFGGFGIPLVGAYFVESHRIEPELFHFRTITKRGTLRWQDVTQIHYSHPHRWFQLVTKDKKVAKVSVALTRLPEFAKTALAAIPPGSMDETTRIVLQDTVKGHPPSMWA